MTALDAVREERRCPHEHWEKRIDWDGDPNVINGTRTWTTLVCLDCGREQWETEREDDRRDAAALQGERTQEKTNER